MYYLYIKNQAAYELYCLEKGIPSENCSLLDKLKSDFATLNYFWISLIFVGFGLTNYSRAQRWQIILRTMNFKTRLSSAFYAVNIAYLANLGFPRIGEFVRAAVFAKSEHLPIDKVFGSVVLDRITDMISFFLLVVLAFSLDWATFKTFFYQHAHMPNLSFNPTIILSILIAIGLLWFFREAILRIQAFQKMLSVFSGIWQSILSIKNLKERRMFIVHTVLVWFWFIMMFIFACKAFEPTAALKPTQIMVIYVFGSFGVFIPSPGGMGTFHYLVILALGIYGIHQADAFSFANIAFAWGQFFALLVFGTGSLILLQVNKRNSKLEEGNVKSS